MPSYVELQVTTNYSFLRGASRVEELFAQAALSGHTALGVTDRNSVAGIARAHGRAAEAGVRLVAGARLGFSDGTDLLLYPTDRAAWSRLCRLISLGRTRRDADGTAIPREDGTRGGERVWHLPRDALAGHAAGLLAVLVPPDTTWNTTRDAGEWDDAAPAARTAELSARLDRLRAEFGERASLALTLRRRPDDAVRLHDLATLAARAGVAGVATGDVLYQMPERRILQDVLTCIREGCTIEDAGFRRERSFDRHLRPPGETLRLFERHPAALARSVELAERARFSLDDLRYQYPDETAPPDEIAPPDVTAQAVLERATMAGAAGRYPGGVPTAVARQLRHELELIARLDYAPYFLTVHAIVCHARAQGILCQGRGSAANSAVCYVLCITAIDPVRSGLLFERFISAERREPPAIDVDFEHGRREEVIQWIYRRYGRERAALCATVMRYRARGAVRDVGRVLGLPEDVTGALAGQVWGQSEEGVDAGHAAALGFDVADRRLRLTLDLARTLIGFPRQLGTHPGGFVLTRDRLDELVPVAPAAMAGRTVIEWDKDDIDALRWMKVDVLGLGMLGCLRRVFALLLRHRGKAMTLADIPAEDPATYRMIQKADTVGTFQIESRAQMAMLPRHRPATFYDLVVQVAVVRPGPIQGDMVHPYLRRRAGLEKPKYPHPDLERVLGKTYGVPLFQEQAMQVAIMCAGFTPGEADQLRRSMATFKVTGGVSHFRTKMIEGMVERGYPPDFAEQTFRQIEGFGSYGFPESHAASFALIAYASAWVKCHHPDIFCAALLNAQPMGFYAPAQLVQDARDHGVAVRPVCVNESHWDCTLEPDAPDVDETGAPSADTERGPARKRGAAAGPRLAVRLGLRMVKGLAEADALRLVARRNRSYRSIDDLSRRASLPASTLERLAEADGFAALGLDRRRALWAVRGLGGATLPLFDSAPDAGAPDPDEPGRAGPTLAGAEPDAAAPGIAASARAPGGADERAPGPPPGPGIEPAVALPAMGEGRTVVEDYRSVGLSLRRHPVALLRPRLVRRGAIACAALGAARDGGRVAVAGLVLVRQRPGSARGVMFVTLEDETGLANLVLWPSVFEANRSLVLSARMIACRGQVQRDEGGVTHLVAERLTDLSGLLRSLGQEEAGDEATRELPVPHGRGDGATHPGAPDPRGIRVPTRDFR